MSDALRLAQELYTNRPAPTNWFKLTIKKGKRKKRAHKKWMKKIGVTAYLRSVKKIIEKDFEEQGLHDKINEAYKDLAVFGTSTIILQGERIG